MRRAISLLSLAATAALTAALGSCVIGPAPERPAVEVRPAAPAYRPAPPPPPPPARPAPPAYRPAPPPPPPPPQPTRRELNAEREYRQLERMAFELQDAASHAHDSAREKFHARDFAGSRKGADEALAAYKNLKDSSRNFYDQVVKYHGDIGHINEEYRRTVHDYNNARDRSTHYGFRVEANLDRVGQILEQLRFIDRH